MSAALRQVQRHLKLFTPPPDTLDAGTLAEVLALALFHFDRVRRLDEEFHENVLSKPAGYDASLAQDIQKLYQMWADHFRPYLDELDRLQCQRLAVEGGDDFRRCCVEVQGILTPDEAFFSAPAFTALRDTALDAHRRGETVDLGGLDD